MTICNSCGGVIGRDCFNPVECQWITDQMNQQSKSNDVQIAHHEGYQQGYNEGYQAELHEILQGKKVDELPF